MVCLFFFLSISLLNCRKKTFILKITPRNNNNNGDDDDDDNDNDNENH